MRGSPVFKPIFKQICSYIIEIILENCKKRPNLGTRPVLVPNTVHMETKICCRESVCVNSTHGQVLSLD